MEAWTDPHRTTRAAHPSRRPGRMPARGALLAMSLIIPAVPATADINPWIQSDHYNPAKWDTAGPQTDTPWLHPGTWTPGQDWGWLSGDLQSDNILGSWGGIRDELELKGISFGLAISNQFAANPVGGEREGGASLITTLGAAAFVDFQRLFGIEERIYLQASVQSIARTPSLSPDYVGNLFGVQVSSSSNSNGVTRLVNAAVAAEMFNNTTEIVGGRINAGDDFATLARACTSLNQAICGNPFVGAVNINFPSYPFSTWGGRIKVKPGEAWYAQVGGYQVYPDFFDLNDHGVEFGIPDGSALLGLAEFGFNLGSRAARPGLPGTYKFGGYVDGESHTNLATGADEGATWAAWAMGEQMLFAEADDKSQGLWAWLALSYSPPDVNELEFMTAGGLSYVGLLPGRPLDTASFVFANGVFSDRLTGQGSETVLEVNYRAQLLPAVYLQPDIQYIIDPDGKSDIDDALVVGFTLGAVF